MSESMLPDPQLRFLAGKQVRGISRISSRQEGSLLEADTDEKCYRKTDGHRFPIIG